MNERADLNQPSFSIAAVERDTGLPKDTLRVWEKRYNFPQPQRDAYGERVYPIDQVEKLRIIKRLLDGGHRPGKIIGLSIEELVRISEVSSAGARLNVAADSLDELNGYMELVKRHDAEEFRQTMSRLALTMGLRRFVVEVVAPLNTMVGDAWARGYFEIFEEHIYTETIQVVLRNALNTIPSARKGPRVLLTTLPNELHGLGLLMAECIFTMEGAQCVSLGTQTPIYDIVLAARAQSIDIVALSFSVVQSSPSTLDAISELREKLPPQVEIWCGGASTALRKRASEQFLLLHTLDSIAESISDWRARNPHRGPNA
ncbi:MAG TPA: MerR family transcriptional regulator [Limnobacter sp.]|uniref:MerR family transcriptional regulator n=1 Tax=Limnobacter sp. TaxID=2003368 RepID=UPI002EDAC281